MSNQAQAGSALWRIQHCHEGDKLMDAVTATLAAVEQNGNAGQANLADYELALRVVQALSTAAQAHYAAANVRYKP